MFLFDAGSDAGWLSTGKLAMDGAGSRNSVCVCVCVGVGTVIRTQRDQKPKTRDQRPSRMQKGKKPTMRNLVLTGDLVYLLASSDQRCAANGRIAHDT